MTVTAETYESLFQEFYENLVGFAYGFTQSETAAEDCVQQVFEKIWAQRNTLQIHTTWKGYLFTAVRNQSLNLKKKRERERDIEGVPETKAEHTPGSQAEQTELKVILDRAIQELPTQCREVFFMKRYEGYSYKEIAKKMGIKEKTVENQLGIALKKLRVSLGDYWNEYQS